MTWTKNLTFNHGYFKDPHSISNQRNGLTRTERWREGEWGSEQARSQCSQRRAPSSSCRWLPEYSRVLTIRSTQTLSRSNPYAANLSRSWNHYHSSINQSLTHHFSSYNKIQRPWSWFTYHVTFPPQAPATLSGFLAATGDFTKPEISKQLNRLLI